MIYILLYRDYCLFVYYLPRFIVFCIFILYYYY